MPTPQARPIAIRDETPTTATQQVTPAKRFVLTPSVYAPSTPFSNLKGSVRWTETQAETTPLPKPPRLLQRVESIEDSSQNSPSAPQDNVTNSKGIATSIENTYVSEEEEEEHGTDDDEDAEILFVSENPSKRRRISPPPPSSPSRSGRDVTQTPHTPAQPKVSTPVAASHRFRIPGPRTSAPSSHTTGFPMTTMTTPAQSHPHFLLPPQPTSPSKTSTPAPDTFSPSRKGQKFVPGGLASTLQSWIVETANTGYQAQTRDTVVWGRDKEDGVKIKLRVSEARSGKGGAIREGDDEGVDCFPGGTVFVKGKVDHPLPGVVNGPRDERVLLAGQGGGRTKRVRLREGDVVGVRAPVWDVNIGDESWMVGIDWVVL
jgi:hypothetical protein